MAPRTRSPASTREDLAALASTTHSLQLTLTEVKGELARLGDKVATRQDVQHLEGKVTRLEDKMQEMAPRLLTVDTLEKDMVVIREGLARVREQAAPVEQLVKDVGALNEMRWKVLGVMGLATLAGGGTIIGIIRYLLH